ncbi:MAG: hypothetical protein B6I20_07760 [Bacteroidetes bacterium 4572_117]|nr:MAG: hypothetical protein B6I20_07760 [Bacteroidetes bacterium 4572_117]
MEINEEFIKEYYTKVKRCFVNENVIYRMQVNRKDGKSIGSWSDIDILAFEPKTKTILDIEVKYRHSTNFHKGNDKTSSIYKVIENFSKPSRINCIKNYNPDNFEVKRIFITNRKAFTEKSRAEFVNLLATDNIEVIYFEKIISALKKHYKKHSDKMTSVIGQMFRLLETDTN